MAYATLMGVMEILLVEDNLEDARLTIEALKRKDVRCQVQIVCDGEEAVDYLHHRGIFAQAPLPDLVLLDMELPKRSGQWLLTEIRADPQLQRPDGVAGPQSGAASPRPAG